MYILNCAAGHKYKFPGRLFFNKSFCGEVNFIEFFFNKTSARKKGTPYLIGDFSATSFPL